MKGGLVAAVPNKVYHYHECRQCGCDLGICGCANDELVAYRCWVCSINPELQEGE